MKFMNTPFSTCVIVVSLALCLAVPAVADWPQMGGPNRDNISPETGLARTWPESGPRALWTAPLGIGFGSPSIRDGKVYILDRIGETQDHLRCFDLETGKELWNYAYDAPGSVSHDGSRTAPTVTADRVYSVGLLGHFMCIDLNTHQPVWSKNIRADFGQDVPGWGVAQAPSLYKDLVIVAPQAPDAFVAAYNKDTGDIVWKTRELGGLGYSTPVIATLCGVDQVVMVNAPSAEGVGTGSVNGLSVEDGAVLWSYHNWNCKIPIPFATVLPEDRLFITGGYKAGSAMIQLRRQDGKFTVWEQFRTDEIGSQIQQPLFYQNHLYINSNSNEREDGMMCVTLDGKILWKTRDKDKSYFSTTFERGPLMLADGLIFNLDGKRGDLYLIEPSPEGYKELAKFHAVDGKSLWAPMALSGGKLLVRGSEMLTCFDVKNP